MQGLNGHNEVVFQSLVFRWGTQSPRAACYMRPCNQRNPGVFGVVLRFFGDLGYVRPLSTPITSDKNLRALKDTYFNPIAKAVKKSVEEENIKLNCQNLEKKDPPE